MYVWRYVCMLCVCIYTHNNDDTNYKRQHSSWPLPAGLHKYMHIYTYTYIHTRNVCDIDDTNYKQQQIRLTCACRPILSARSLFKKVATVKVSFQFCEVAHPCQHMSYPQVPCMHEVYWKDKPKPTSSHFYCFRMEFVNVSTRHVKSIYKTQNFVQNMDAAVHTLKSSHKEWSWLFAYMYSHRHDAYIHTSSDLS
jgi:hypothetical protein